MRKRLIAIVLLCIGAIGCEPCSSVWDQPTKIEEITGVPYGFYPQERCVTFIVEREQGSGEDVKYNLVICMFDTYIAGHRICGSRSLGWTSESLTAFLDTNLHMKIHEKIILTGHFDGPIFIVQSAKFFGYLIDINSVSKVIPKELEKK